MKKKNVRNESITRSVLREELEIIREGLNKELTRYATKEELSKLKDEMNENFRKYRDEVLSRMDFFIKDMEINREDRDLAVHQTRELGEKVDNHEKRIKKLEAHL